jgi:hypothetical protein
MRRFNKLSKVVMLAAALVLTSFTLSFGKPHVDYRFKVRNKTKVTIKKLLVSEDGKKWGYFDVGAGIPAGATQELVWDKSTDNSGCEWYVKAVYADGDESEPARFDFCEKDLVLEFS